MRNEKGWMIFDEKKVYIQVYYPTEKEADIALEDLLFPYPLGHFWRDRLKVRHADIPSLRKSGEPAYGWYWEKDSRGVVLVPNKKEQEIIRMVKRYRSKKLSPKEIAQQLMRKKLRPRHGVTWTEQTMEEIEDGKSR